MKHIQKFESFGIKEGVAFKDAKNQHGKEIWDPKKKDDFRTKIKDLVKSKGLDTKQVGNDIEILHNKVMIAQVMFRDEYVGVKKKGVKFADEFKYTELGKIKAKVGDICKDVD